MKFTCKIAAAVLFAGVALAAGPSIDVTGKVAAAVKGSAVNLPVTNMTMGSDPAKGQTKQLRVEYSQGEAVRTNTVNEKKTLVIEAEPGKRLIILKATYGVL
jgi:hypothetical protein